MALDLLLALSAVLLATWAMVLFLMSVWHIWRLISPAPAPSDAELEAERERERERE